MILTVTLNPAADQTLVLRQVAVGATNRVDMSYLDPGGKGINASRVLHRMGCATLALGFLAGDIGRLVQQALDDEGVQHCFRAVPGQTRLNTQVIDQASGTSTVFHDRGPEVPPKSLADLMADVARWLRSARVLVLAGSLPPGVPQDIYARLIGQAREHRVPAVLDTDGEALRLGIAAGPTLVKPNLDEAQALLGRPLQDRAEVVAAAQDLVGRGIPYVVISMGARGAIGTWDGQVWEALPPRVERRSTVGSGDSMVAGLARALAEGWAMTEGLRLGTAAGAATAMTPGTALAAPEDIARLLPEVQLRRCA